MIFTGLVPFLYLSLMNLLIYKKLKMNKLSNVRSRSVATKSAGNLAAILIVVGKSKSVRKLGHINHLVLVFLITNIPRLVLNLAELTAQNLEGKS